MRIQPDQKDGNPVFQTDENGNVQYDEYGPMQMHYPVYSDIIEVTVTAVDALSLEGKVDDIGLPEILEWDGRYHGENHNDVEIALTATMPDYADHLRVTVNVAEEDGRYWDEPIKQDSTDGTDPLTVTLTHNELRDWNVRAGQTIVVEVYASGAGYDSAFWARRIPIVDANMGGDPVLVVQSAGRHTRTSTD